MCVELHIQIERILKKIDLINGDTQINCINNVLRKN